MVYQWIRLKKPIIYITNIDVEKFPMFLSTNALDQASFITYLVYKLKKIVEYWLKLKVQIKKRSPTWTCQMWLISRVSVANLAKKNLVIFISTWVILINLKDVWIIYWFYVFFWNCLVRKLKQAKGKSY